MLQMNKNNEENLKNVRNIISVNFEQIQAEL